jgi:hypothetical protein
VDGPEAGVDPVAPEDTAAGAVPADVDPVDPADVDPVDPVDVAPAVVTAGVAAPVAATDVMVAIASRAICSRT